MQSGGRIRGVKSAGQDITHFSEIMKERLNITYRHTYPLLTGKVSK